MNKRIEMLLDRYVVNKEQKQYRREKRNPYLLAEEYAAHGIGGFGEKCQASGIHAQGRKTCGIVDEKFALLRTIPDNYEIFTKEEFEKIQTEHYIHEQGKVCNINPEYSLLMNAGFGKKREEIQKLKEVYREDEGKLKELEAFERVLTAISAFAERYRQEALRVGNQSVAEMFSNIPENPPGPSRRPCSFCDFFTMGCGAVLTIIIHWGVLTSICIHTIRGIWKKEGWTRRRHWTFWKNFSSAAIRTATFIRACSKEIMAKVWCWEV